MTRLAAFLSLAFLATVTASNSNNLRSSTPHDQQHEEAAFLDSNQIKQEIHRQLQGGDGSIILNALISQLTPTLGEFLQEELDAYDPIVWGNQTTVDLGQSDFGGACPSQASLTYGVGKVNGLGNMNLDKVEMVAGSQDIDVSFLALNGATWTADWKMDASFPAVVGDTFVGLLGNLCGFPLNQTLNGVATVSNASVEVIVQVNGETARVLSFQDSSQVTSAVVQQVKLQLGAVALDFGVDGDLVQLNVTENLENMLLDNFSADIEPLVIQVVNSVLAAQAPFSLAEDGLEVSRSSNNNGSN